jgi:hypothetical protein
MRRPRHLKGSGARITMTCPTDRLSIPDPIQVERKRAVVADVVARVVRYSDELAAGTARKVSRECEMFLMRAPLKGQCTWFRYVSHTPVTNLADLSDKAFGPYKRLMMAGAERSRARILRLYGATAPNSQNC